MTGFIRQFVLSDLTATAALAARLAEVTRPRDVLALAGPLGAGKSALARAFIRHRIGDPELEVPSPTFTLVQVYGDPDAETGAIWHFDLYRVEDPEDCWELGFEEAVVDGICLIEWPDRLGELLPGDRLDVVLEPIADEMRRATLTGSDDWAARLRDWEIPSRGGTA